MSMTLTLPEVRLENPSRLSQAQASVASEEDLKYGVPSLTSLRKFASKLHLGSRHWRDRDDDRGGTAIRASATEQPPQAFALGSRKLQRAQIQDRAPIQPLTQGLFETTRQEHIESPNPVPSAVTEEQSGSCSTRHVPELEETVEKIAAKTKPISRLLPVSEHDTVKTEADISDARTTLGEQRRAVQHAIMLENGGKRNGPTKTERNANDENSTSHATFPSSSMPHAASTIPTTPSYPNPSISAKGKESGHRNQLNPLNVQVPGSRLDKLFSIRIAPPDTLKAEIMVEHSAADRERLANFSGILRSAKARMELFGRDMPLIRILLVQVTEGDSSPKDYICIQGLSTQRDITTFHAAMSQKRYKPCYQPLKLCYDTSKLNKVSSTEPDAVDSSSHWSSPAIDPAETSSGNLSEPFRLYRPVFNDQTYCGALLQTIVDEKPWVSTLGGVVQVGDGIYIMACQHSPQSSFESPMDVSWTSNDLHEEELKGDAFVSEEDIEKPLVFATGGFSQEYDVPHIPEAKDSFPFIGGEWKQLGLNEKATVGSEWCLLPIQSHSLRPNFVEVSFKTSEVHYQRERHYLDQISEPRGGCPAFFATGTDCGPSGTVLGNSSFILAGGTDGVLEVWTAVLPVGQNILKGNSGSWVIDTSDAVQYKVIGSTVAASEGEAHFINIADQFHAMTETVGKGEAIRLVPAFRALISCANLAFQNGDPKSEYFIEEALSPRILDQFHEGWSSDCLKIFLRNNGYHDSLVERARLRDLLLRYGCELIDSLPDSNDFRNRHDDELSAPQSRILELMQSYIEHAQRREEDAQAIERFAQRTERDAQVRERGAIFTERYAQMRERQYLANLETPVQPIFAKPPLAQDRRRREYPEPSRPAKQQKSLVPVFSKHDSLSRRTLSRLSVLLILAVGVASASGVGAALVLRLVQSNDNQKPPEMTINKYETIGAVVGPILATITVVQILLIFLPQIYHLPLPCGVRSLDILPRSWMRNLWTVAITVVSAVARMILPALYVTEKIEFEDAGTILAAAAAAAAPLLISTASPIIFWNIATLFYQYNRHDQFEVCGLRVAFVPSVTISYIICLIPMTGFDALTGYTFGRMCQNSGRPIPSASSSAAGAAVMGTLTTILVSLPITLFFFRLHYKTILCRYGPRADNKIDLRLQYRSPGPERV